MAVPLPFRRRFWLRWCRGREHRDEDVVVTLVTPVEMRAVRPVANLYSMVVRPVDGDGVVKPPCEDARVFKISPLAVRPERVLEVVGVVPDEGVVRIISLLVAGE